MSAWRKAPELQRMPRRFLLRRNEDRTGISGIGYVAAGVRFPDGVCALRWMSEFSSTAVYSTLADLVAIHGHEGATIIDWIDPELEHVALSPARPVSE